MDKDTRIVVIGIVLTIATFLLAVYFRLKN